MWGEGVQRSLRCAASRQDGTPPDPRVGEAVELVRSARQDGGTWIQEQRFPGCAWFEADVPPGQPSPWLTVYVTRAPA
ncbi:hypothetical protein [Sinomonas sp. P47F7]|uniref:hypothetical protein n=1 Tax=Sinomonas sp. P47F7 TaxID=3410987 RepID=UPI003BF4F012